MTSSETLKILYVGTNGYSGYIHLKKLVSSGETIVGVITHPIDIRSRLVRMVALLARIFRLRGCSFQTIIERTQYDLSKISRDYKLPLFLVKDINSGTSQKLCASLNPDLMVVGSWDQQIQEHILKIPKLGCINSHPAYLPRHRGASPHISAIINDERETGVTIHYMDKEFDTGKIILQKKSGILDSDTGYSLLNKLVELGSETVLEALQLIKQGRVAASSQNNDTATYDRAWKWRRDGRIDWSKKSREIYNLVRAAFKPGFLGCGGGAYTYYQGKIVKIWEAEDLKESYTAGSNPPPGTILEVDGNGFIVSCGSQGVILVKTVQQEGILYGRIPAAVYARKVKMRPGSMFES